MGKLVFILGTFIFIFCSGSLEAQSKNSKPVRVGGGFALQGSLLNEVSNQDPDYDDPSRQPGKKRRFSMAMGTEWFNEDPHPSATQIFSIGPQIDFNAIEDLVKEQLDRVRTDMAKSNPAKKADIDATIGKFRENIRDYSEEQVRQYHKKRENDLHNGIIHKLANRSAEVTYKLISRIYFANFDQQKPSVQPLGEVLVGSTLSFRKSKRNTIASTSGFLAGSHDLAGSDLDIGLFLKIPILGKITPVIRFSYGGWRSLSTVEHEGIANAYTMIEIETGWSALRKSLLGAILFRFPGTQTFLDISAFASVLPENVVNGLLQLTEIEAGYKVLSLDTENIEEKIEASLSPYIPLATLKRAQYAATFAATVAPYTSEAINDVRWLMCLREILNGATVKVITGSAGKAFIIGDLVVTATEFLTDPATIEYFQTGSVSLKTEMYRTFQYADLVLDPRSLDDWVKSGRASYPEILEILQTASSDKNLPETGRREASRAIQNSNILKFMNSLENYGKTQGFPFGMLGLNAGQMAEAIWITSNHREATTKHLQEVFGLFRYSQNPDDFATWWIVASETDEAVLPSQRMAWDSIASIWRTELEQKNKVLQRKINAIRGFSKYLGVQLTPEIRPVKPARPFKHSHH